MSEEQVYTVRVAANGTIRWYNAENHRHRLDGPAYEGNNGYKAWYQNGERHRLDGPAVEWADGSKEWFQNGKLHRLDGPAVEYTNGDKFWFQNGKRHREDGPAIEYASGAKYWYIEDEKLTESEFNERIKPKDPCDGRYITLENGRKYLLTAV